MEMSDLIGNSEEEDRLEESLGAQAYPDPDHFRLLALGDLNDSQLVAIPN